MFVAEQRISTESEVGERNVIGISVALFITPTREQANRLKRIFEIISTPLAVRGNLIMKLL